MPSPPQSPPKSPAPGAGLAKLVLEFGPLLLFFVLNKLHTHPADPEAGVEAQSGIVLATKWFLVAALAAFPLAWWLEKKLPVMLLLGTVAIGVFGGLTWWLEDDFFIKIKPTVFSAGLGAVLLGGALRQRYFLENLFGDALRLSDAGWRQLTLRYALFFFALAGLNEAVWRTTSDSTWVSFKVFGIFPLTLLFVMSQMGLMKRHELAPEEPS